VRYVVSEHGLARARRTADQVHPTGYEPTLGGRVEAGDTVRSCVDSTGVKLLRGRDRYSV